MLFGIMMRLIYSLILVLIFVLLCSYASLDTSLMLIISCVVALFFIIEICILLSSHLVPITIRSDGVLLLQRKRINIHDIKELYIYNKKLFLGQQRYVDIKTNKGKIYAISISEPKQFCSEIVEYNKSIEVKNSILDLD